MFYTYFIISLLIFIVKLMITQIVTALVKIKNFLTMGYFVRLLFLTLNVQLNLCIVLNYAPRGRER